MTSITIDVEDAQFQKLAALAKSQGLSVEEMIQSQLRQWLSSSETELNEATDYVLEKNSGLYQRIASW